MPLSMVTFQIQNVRGIEWPARDSLRVDEIVFGDNAHYGASDLNDGRPRERLVKIEAGDCRQDLGVEFAVLDGDLLPGLTELTDWVPGDITPELSESRGQLGPGPRAATHKQVQVVGLLAGSVELDRSTADDDGTNTVPCKRREHLPVALGQPELRFFGSSSTHRAEITCPLVVAREPGIWDIGVAANATIEMGEWQVHSLQASARDAGRERDDLTYGLDWPGCQARRQERPQWQPSGRSVIPVDQSRVFD